MENTVALVRTMLPGNDQTLPDRKKACAIVRMSRGGKTRALVELTNKLREGGVAALFVTFNGDTSLLVPEPDLVRAFFRRLSFEIAGRRVPWGECGVADVQKWLTDCTVPVVLLVDELNRALPPAGLLRTEHELWLAISTMCFNVPNRALVFSSHINETRSQMMDDFFKVASFRQVVAISPPRVIDVHKAARQFGTTVDVVHLMGRVPAHLAAWESVAAKVSALAKADFDVTAFAAACLDGDMEEHELPLSITQLSAVEVTDDGARRRWVPYTVAGVLRARGYKELFHLLHSALTSKEASGQVWELVVLLALVVRRLANKMHPMLRPVPAGLGQVAFTRGAHTVKNVTELVAWANAQPGSAPHLVVFPLHAQFEVYDVVELVRDGDHYRAFSGYSMKEGADAPQVAPPIAGASYFFSRKARGAVYAPKRGWIKASGPDMRSFLGESLSEMLPPGDWV